MSEPDQPSSGAASRTSECWVDGRVVTKAELTRCRKAQVEFEAAAADRSKLYSTAVRRVPCLIWLIHPSAHSQGGAGEADGEKPFELTQKEWLGQRKRVGDLSANSSQFSSIVFGEDLDQSTAINEIEQQMAQLPQFRDSAGMFSSQQPLNTELLDKPPSSSLFTQLKNSSALDQLVFGGEEGREPADRIENSHEFEGSAGVHSSAKDKSQATFCHGGRRGKHGTSMDHTASSVDLSFQTRASSACGSLKQLPEFESAAGAPSALMNPDGSYRHAVRRAIRPPEEMSTDFAAVTDASELHSRPVIRPVLSSEHGKGSISSIVFSRAERIKSREVLGVPSAGADAAGSGQRRREALAVGCRSQGYIDQPEFTDAAGLPSDQQHFVDTTEVVRRIKPLARLAPHATVTAVDKVVYGHDLQGAQHECASLGKGVVFGGAAGVSSDVWHKQDQLWQTMRAYVPRMRDHDDEVVCGQDHPPGPREVMGEVALLQMQLGGAGQSSAGMGQGGLDTRLHESSAEQSTGGVRPDDTLTRRYEPPGSLRAATPLSQEPCIYPSSYQEAHGVSRDKLGRIEARSRFVPEDEGVGGDGGGVAAVRGTRLDLDSSEVRGVLRAHEPREPPALVVGKAAADVAGRSSRTINDESVPLLRADENKKIAKSPASITGSENMSRVLSGEGYYTIGSTVEESARKGRLIDPRTAVDSVSRLNILQPERNLAEANQELHEDAWMHGKTEFEIQQYKKQFGSAPPYGTEAIESLGQLNKVSHNQATDIAMLQKLAQARERVSRKEEPKTNERQPQQFQPPLYRCEAEGCLRQRREVAGLGAKAPFGVDAESLSYKTSSQEGLQAGVAAWGGADIGNTSSMASRLARRRLERRSPRPSDVSSTKR
ncbi:MAG: hypothetical protein SGPRY_007079 [Prymnesium sp.]